MHLAKVHAKGLQVGLEQRALAEISAHALSANYRVITRSVPNHRLIPMIKARAYGHGAAWAAKTLIGLPRLYGIGVATLEEGREIREALADQGSKTSILVFSGAARFNEVIGQYCARWGLTPVITSFEAFRELVETGYAKKIPYHLKFNTGMNRLGISLDRVGAVRRMLAVLPTGARPGGVLSHLAMGDRYRAPLMREQISKFKVLQADLSDLLGHADFHLANSAAIWRARELGIDRSTSLSRPGISLYGVRPGIDEEERGLQPVLRLSAPVVQVIDLKARQAVGYGATWKAKRNTQIAILGIGYADGVSRALSNRGYVSMGGRLCPIRGIISMDLCAVEWTGAQRLNPSKPMRAEIIGPSIDLWQQARSAGTVPYELLTSLSERVQRKYG